MTWYGLAPAATSSLITSRFEAPGPVNGVKPFGRTALASAPESSSSLISSGEPLRAAVFSGVAESPWASTLTLAPALIRPLTMRRSASEAFDCSAWLRTNSSRVSPFSWIGVLTSPIFGRNSSNGATIL
ncbi:hypothetical protein D3C76_1477180 [compost metagenome]